jgi:hypothetical protein
MTGVEAQIRQQPRVAERDPAAVLKNNYEQRQAERFLSAGRLSELPGEHRGAGGSGSS